MITSSATNINEAMKVGSPVFSLKRLPYLFLIILILLFALLGFRAVEKPLFAQRQKTENNGIPVLDRFKNDPVVQFIGMSFDDIKQQLGEPHEHGSSSWLGAHSYILYHFKDGYIRFSSPDSEENSVATSIIIGPGQEVLGARVGMDFPEIVEILGPPDFGPELGLDDHYYLDYYLEEPNDQSLQVLLSFSADEANSPTRDVFIKWENHQY
jgi:hypothetical protein